MLRSRGLSASGRRWKTVSPKQSRSAGCGPEDPPLKTTGMGGLPISDMSIRKTRGSSGWSGWRTMPRLSAGIGLSGCRSSCRVADPDLRCGPHDQSHEEVGHRPGCQAVPPAEVGPDLRMWGQVGAEGALGEAQQVSHERQPEWGGGAARRPAHRCWTARSRRCRRPGPSPSGPGSRRRLRPCLRRGDPPPTPRSKPRPTPEIRGSGWKWGRNIDESVSGRRIEPVSLLPPPSSATT